jgi:outer membrane protein
MALVSFTFASMAQKGSWYVGGLAGFSASTDKDATNNNLKTVYSSWAFSPELGTFLTNEVQLGFVVGLSGDTEKFDGEKRYQSFSFSPTLYGRYFFKITDNFSTFTGIYLQYISGNDKTFYGDYYREDELYKTTHSGFGAKLGIGVCYALSPRFSILGQYGLLGWSSIGNKDKDGNKLGTSSDFDFGVNTVSGSVFNVGIYYTFKEKN